MKNPTAPFIRRYEMKEKRWRKPGRKGRREIKRRHFGIWLTSFLSAFLPSFHAILFVLDCRSHLRTLTVSAWTGGLAFRPG